MVDNSSNEICTVNVSRISHRKWRESKQQLVIRLLDLIQLGCILVSFHILCVILLTFTVNISKLDIILDIIIHDS